MECEKECAEGDAECEKENEECHDKVTADDCKDKGGDDELECRRHHSMGGCVHHCEGDEECEKKCHEDTDDDEKHADEQIAAHMDCEATCGGDEAKCDECHQKVTDDDCKDAGDDEEKCRTIHAIGGCIHDCDKDEECEKKCHDDNAAVKLVKGSSANTVGENVVDKAKKAAGDAKDAATGGDDKGKDGHGHGHKTEEEEEHIKAM